MFDLTRGSLLAVPSKPRSRMGTIKFTPDIYTATHNQPCEKCARMFVHIDPLIIHLFKSIE